MVLSDMNIADGTVLLSGKSSYTPPTTQKASSDTSGMLSFMPITLPPIFSASERGIMHWSVTVSTCL